MSVTHTSEPCGCEKGKKGEEAAVGGGTGGKISNPLPTNMSGPYPHIALSFC